MQSASAGVANDRPTHGSEDKENQVIGRSFIYSSGTCGCDETISDTVAVSASRILPAASPGDSARQTALLTATRCPPAAMISPILLADTPPIAKAGSPTSPATSATSSTPTWCSKPLRGRGKHGADANVVCAVGYRATRLLQRVRGYPHQHVRRQNLASVCHGQLVLPDVELHRHWRAERCPVDR